MAVFDIATTPTAHHCRTHDQTGVHVQGIGSQVQFVTTPARKILILTRSASKGLPIRSHDWSDLLSCRGNSQAAIEVKCGIRAKVGGESGDGRTTEHEVIVVRPSKITDGGKRRHYFEVRPRENRRADVVSIELRRRSVQILNCDFP